MSKEFNIDRFTGMIEPVTKSAEEYYGLSVLGRLSREMPVIFEGRKLQQFAERFSHEQLIACYAQQMQICGQEFTDDIKSICGELAEKALNDLLILIKSSPIQCFLIAMSMLQQNLILTFGTLSWYHGYLEDAVPEMSENKFINALNASLCYMTRDNNEKEISAIYKAIEGFLSVEKLALQLLVEVTHDHFLDGDEIQDIINPAILLQKARALYDLIRLREEASNEIGCLKKLIVASDGNIEVERGDEYDEFYYRLGEIFTNWVAQKDNRTIDQMFIDKLDPICKKHTGFTINEIMTLSDNILEEYNPNTILLAQEADFIDEIINQSGKNEGDIRALMKFLMRPTVNENCYTNIASDRPWRPLRKSVLLLGDSFVITSAVMFLLSLKGIIFDIFDNKIQEPVFKSEVSLILDEINKKFELDVTETITTNLTHHVCHSLDKIGSKPPFLLLPGEIDILVLYNRKLFVVECKNYPLKYTPQAMGNELNKLRKSVARKLESKIKFVHEHKELIIALLGASREDVDFTQKPMGVIVTNKFSLAEALDDMPFPVVNHCNLVSWLQGCVDEQ